jgi:DNA-binding IclR family transcriptional regulator
MTTEHAKVPRSSAAETGQLQTLHRALDLLEAMAGAECSLAGLSETLGLARTTTHRLLATLTTRGYVQQDAQTGRYRIGIRTFEIGSVFLSQNQIKDLAHPILRELNQQFNETITLAILSGDEAVYVDVVESSQTLRTFARVGARVPLHSTGVGKALLMGFSPSELARYAKVRPFQPYTQHTVTSVDVLVNEIHRAREVGYVLDREEHYMGVRCGAAPVWNHTGAVVAALSISGPTYRIVDKFWITTAQAVAAAARELSRCMGYQEPQSAHAKSHR